MFLVAAEPSGDLLARETAEAIKSQAPGVKLAGIGGGELKKIGIESPIDIAPLSILGLFEGLKAYGTVVKLADAAADSILAFEPDAVILVDSWGFMLRVAQRVRDRNPAIKLIKLVGPQVWATRPGRAKTLSNLVDHLICIHQMETDYYEPHGLPVTVMGNPALSRTQRGDRDAFRSKLGLSGSEQMVLILPGSRPSEIKRVAPVLMEAAWLLKSERPELRIVTAPAPSVRAQFVADYPNLADWAVITDEGDEAADIMAAADLALACSGTVTSELAVQGTPFIVGYKTDWITWSLARYLLYKPEHITLLNIAADDTEIAPEYVQTRFRADLLAERAGALLSDADALRVQTEAQNKALSRMGERDEDAPFIAAQTILNVISDQK
ncbi:MAG: lipid-A-disaccharide synthase [Henriciella sp.]|nr:lipid-A-disaccharide synthase [Henriciella sp.]MBO6694385.1 lipid-A-disaccharide synthase [Henriciella sp.]